jgi:nitroreductase/FMN reductase [NAD(P)H]
MFEDRFGDNDDKGFADVDSSLLDTMAQRGSCRDFQDKPVPMGLLNILCATALASPTKSDLQQRDIVMLQSSTQRQRVADLVSGQAWVADAPMIVIFCGNNRRQRLLHEWHEVPFANDHLDAFFNATADAAIALGAFVTAAEALGLGCCPISAVRNEPRAVSDLLDLPEHVFAMAGLAVGYPSHTAMISKRLPLDVTCHVDRYQESSLQEVVQSYDVVREVAQPYAAQRFPDDFGESDAYGWSTDKVRQYSKPERAGFGAFVRSIGYRLE